MSPNATNLAYPTMSASRVHIRGQRAQLRNADAPPPPRGARATARSNAVKCCSVAWSKNQPVSFCTTLIARVVLQRLCPSKSHRAESRNAKIFVARRKSLSRRCESFVISNDRSFAKSQNVARGIRRAAQVRAVRDSAVRRDRRLSRLSRRRVDLGSSHTLDGADKSTARGAITGKHWFHQYSTKAQSSGSQFVAFALHLVTFFNTPTLLYI